MLINVYAKPYCPACQQTKRLMSKLDIDYTEAPITDDVLAFAKKRDLHQAPIVTVFHQGDTINDVVAWDGFRPDLIKKLSEA